MREIIIVIIVFTGLIVLGFWAMTITLAVKSGEGVLSLFSRQRKSLNNSHFDWLSAADTIAQYGGDHTERCSGGFCPPSSPTTD
jgi:hypothetical protein